MRKDNLICIVSIIWIYATNKFHPATLRDAYPDPFSLSLYHVSRIYLNFYYYIKFLINSSLLLSCVFLY